MSHLDRTHGMQFMFLVVTLAAGCGDPEPPPEMEAEIARLGSEIEERSARLEEVQRELGEMREAVRGIEIPEIALAELERPPATARDSLDAFAAHLRRTEQTARAAGSRAQTVQQRLDSLRTEHEMVRDTLGAHLERERERVAELENERAELARRGEELAAESERLSTTLDELQDQLATAYWVAGTRDDLLARGIVTEEGGARFLGFLWKRGETLVPARGLDPGEFTAIDIEEQRDIPLPTPDRGYSVVSRHDPSLLSAEPGNEGGLHGERLQITDPAGFWRPSRFLILVADE